MSACARALYDPGTNISMINQKFIESINEEITPLESYTVCKTMGGVRLLTGVIKIGMKIKNIKRRILWFFVIDDETFEYDVLLGIDSIQIFRLNQELPQLNITQEK